MLLLGGTDPKAGSRRRPRRCLCRQDGSGHWDRGREPLGPPPVWRSPSSPGPLPHRCPKVLKGKVALPPPPTRRRTRPYPVAPVGLLAELPLRKAPQSSARLPRLPLGFLEALDVLHVWREGGHLRITFFKEHLVEHPPIGQPDIGQQPPVAIHLLDVELEGRGTRLRSACDSELHLSLPHPPDLLSLGRIG